MTFDAGKRLLVGRPLRSERPGDTLVPKWVARPVFCSDPLSSVACATEAILVALSLGGLAILRVLRAFANGRTALTGVEAVSNGVPAFRRPTSRNTAQTLEAMAFLAATMFVGITVLAVVPKVRVADPAGQLGLPAGTYTRNGIAQVAGAVFGLNTPGFIYLQVFTAAILVLAANTAFNGFPVLASILANDRYLPRQLYTRGDRRAYSNGIVLLALFAALLLVGFNANAQALLHRYIIGVITAVTVAVDDQEAAELHRTFDQRDLSIPLTMLDSPYRETTRPLLEHIRRIHRESPRDLCTVVIPEYVVGRWWEHLLHKQSAFRLKTRLLFEPGVTMVNVPYQLASSRRRVAVE